MLRKEVFSTKMKKLELLTVAILVAVSAATAQTNTPPTYFGGDVLGAHNGYGRGCVMCHAPHSGSLGNGVAMSKDTQNGMYALWGQDLTPLYGQSFSFSGDGNFKSGSTTQNTQARYPVTLPAAGTLNSAHDANTVILFCLSCHDGVLTKVGMMKGQTVETLPVVGGNAPTLLAKAAPSGGLAYNNDHPVGANAVVSCGGQYNWDCTGGGATTTAITMGGTASKAFLTNYPASFWSSGSNPLASFNNGAIVNAVTCTTCHDQHSMTVWTVGGKSYTTMFFVRGEYNPYSGGNQVAQFCRNCHGGESNEMHGLMTIPTT